MHHVYPTYLGTDNVDVVFVSQAHHACLHYLIWAHERDHSAASSFVAVASSWKRRNGKRVVADALIYTVASANLSTIVRNRSHDSLIEDRKKGGRASVEANSGIHGLTYEQRVIYGHKGQQKQMLDGRPARALSWIVTDPNGNAHEVYNLDEFCRNNGLSKAHMCRVAKGLRKHHKNYTVTLK